MTAPVWQFLQPVLLNSLQGEREGGSLVDLGLGPNAAAVLMNDALHRGQSYTCSLEVFLAVQALKDAKKLIGIFHIETHAVIAHVHRPLAIHLLLADLDDGEPVAYPSLVMQLLVAGPELSHVRIRRRMNRWEVRGDLLLDSLDDAAEEGARIEARECGRGGRGR